MRLSAVLDLPPDAPLCTSGKPPYRTAAAALSALGRGRAAVTADPSSGHRPAGHYQCEACSWFHLRSANGRQRRGSLGNRKNAGGGRRR